MQRRSYGIDFLKLIAAFGVVALHVGHYNELPSYMGEYIRVSFRWAVPVFFIISGFFIQVTDNVTFLKVVKKAVRLFILSSLLYLPVLFYQNNFNIERFYERLFSFITLIEGGYFHLWYLSSFVLGLILWKSLDVLNVRALKIVLSTAIIVAYFYADLTGNEHTNVFRHFVGLPFLLIGSKLAKQQHTNDKHIKTLGFCFPFILFLYFFEPYWSNFIGFTGPVKRQFPFFTILVAPLLFLLFYNLKFKLFTQRLSKIGLEHALGIYIFHPIFLLIAFKVMSEFGLSHSIVALFSGFLSTILFLELLKRWLPSLHSFLLAK